jgi:hypothetical protein
VSRVCKQPQFPFSLASPVHSAKVPGSFHGFIQPSFRQATRRPAPPPQPPMSLHRLLTLLLPALLSACTSPTDGIDAPAGTPSCRLVFAQGVLQTVIPSALPVQPMQINDRTPSVLRWDHNAFTVPAGPIKVVVQGFGSGTSASAALQFDGKPGETYRFGHQPTQGAQTTFVIMDSKDRLIGTSGKSLENRPSQSPLYMPQLD